MGDTKEANKTKFDDSEVSRYNGKLRVGNLG